jgi:predicted nucleic acid-binding protein
VSLILDSSATLARAFPEENSPSIIAVFDLVSRSGAWVPGLWKLEVANVLEMGVRRGRHDAAFRDETLSDLALLPIQLDSETSERAWGPTVRLAERHRLTVYDAAYLELALRRELPLASLDQQLRAAAKAEKVQLLGQ